MEKFLTDVCDITTGKLDSNAAVDNGKYPFFTCAPQPLQIDNYEFDEDAILLAGNNAQGNFHINRYNGKFNAYQRTYVITAKTGYDIDYIKYAIEMSLSHLKKIAQGSQTKFLTMTMLDDFKVEDRDYAEQCELIASVKAIDNKISINNAINDNLQQMAHMTYMHLFFGKNPNGSLGEILIEQPKSDIQVGDAKEADGEIPFFTSGDAVLRWSTALADGRNCFLNTGGNAGIKFYVGETAYSTDTWCITGKDSLSDYLYLLLDSLKAEINKKFFQGTGLKHLQKPLLKERPIYIPSQSERESFNAMVVPWLTMVSDNIRESQQLTALRDWLLPMLMNGQATISD